MTSATNGPGPGLVRVTFELPVSYRSWSRVIVDDPKLYQYRAHPGCLSVLIKRRSRCSRKGALMVALNRTTTDSVR